MMFSGSMAWTLLLTDFRIAELKKCYLPGPRPMTYTYQGFAERV
jgi:hypothetical protein